jgi:hypothetical protein
METVSTTTAPVLPDIRDLDRLLGVLQSHHVYSFKCNGIEILLSPKPLETSQAAPLESSNEDSGNYGIWSSKELA